MSNHSIQPQIMSSSESSSDEEYDPSGALDDIDSTLDDLEKLLQPLFDGEQSLEDVLDEQSTDMDKAKTSMVMAYGLCDLLFGEFTVSLAQACP